MSASLPVIDVENLTHTYPAPRRGAPSRQALRGVSFSVNPGEIFGLLGPNGGGKSTTFHILSTLFPQGGGSAKIFGVPVNADPDKVRASLGVVFQMPSLDRKLTVEENLRHQGRLYGLSSDVLQKRIRENIRQVGLSDRAQDRVETLSGGLKRRLELAKGLLHEPRLLLLDEPTTGLDPGARRDVWEYINELKLRHGMTILLTTHLMEEAERCDRVLILHDGRIVAMGTPAALKNEIGGDVITVESSEPEGFAQEVQKKFGGDARVVDGSVRIERSVGHEFVPQLVSAFPGRINSITVGKPTLEDVFVRHTGHRFWAADQENHRE